VSPLRSEVSELVNALSWDEVLNAYAISSLLHSEEYELVIESEGGLAVAALYKFSRSFVARGDAAALARLARRADELSGCWCYAALPRDLRLFELARGVGLVVEEYLMAVDRSTFRPRLAHESGPLGEEHLGLAPICDDAPYERAELEYMIRKGRAYGAFTEEGDVASVAFLQDSTPSVAMIGGVYTRADLRGMGYASSCVSALVESLLSDFAVVGLTVSADNLPALRLYERLGFRPYSKLVSFEAL